ncbi:MAG: dienelactone hydrolase family protein [Actinophytocola sp.]|uniref:dienelactone hydrolase family protein n=1 Tax=Actinophytocola sp. TaxID=1872138 RepID=UPI003C75634F
MPRQNVVITTEDGECAATLHTPSDQAGHPGVLMYPDAIGARETFAGMGDQLAGLGYTVLVPDIYYRDAPYAPFDAATVFGDQEERARLGALAGSITTERAIADAGAFLEFLAGRAEVSGSSMGTTGYCMGGKLSLLAAAHHPDRVAAAASFHGGNLAAEDDPDSPYRVADRIRAAVLVAAAQDDRSFPPEQYDRLERALTEAGVRHTLAVYPAKHGFAVPDNDTYDTAAAQRHWAALESLYGETLLGQR